MQEESNPIKDHLFEYIEKSTTIPEFIKHKRFDKIIEEITLNCYDKVINMAQKDEAVGILATGLLHYLLTNSLINSQRKIEYNETEIDIVIPDIKTLEKDTKKTLIICIPKSSERKVVEEKISQLEKFQPHKENIWTVLSRDITLDTKSYILSKENNSFSKIIFDIAQFSNVNGGDSTNKFKILRV